MGSVRTGLSWTDIYVFLRRMDHNVVGGQLTFNAQGIPLFSLEGDKAEKERAFQEYVAVCDEKGVRPLTVVTYCYSPSQGVERFVVVQSMGVLQGSDYTPYSRREEITDRITGPGSTHQVEVMLGSSGRNVYEKFREGLLVKLTTNGFVLSSAVLKNGGDRLGTLTNIKYSPDTGMIEELDHLPEPQDYPRED